MNTRIAAILFLTVVASLGPASNLAAQVTPVTPSTAVTYQGRLNDGAAPANGSYDFEFSIFNANGIFRIAGPLTLTNVPVSNGLFTAHLDFDPDLWASPGNNARLLEVAVRSAGRGDFTPLSPRHPITPAPFALRTLGVSGNSLSAGIETQRRGERRVETDGERTQGTDAIHEPQTQRGCEMKSSKFEP
jgi:hypothetical protein